MADRQLGKNVVVITNPLTADVEVQIPITVAQDKATILVSYNRHSDQTALSLDAATPSIDRVAAYKRARTRVCGLLATTKEDYISTIMRRCVHALDSAIGHPHT